MILIGFAFTWLVLTSGSVAVCRAAASRDGALAGNDADSRVVGRDARDRSPLICERRGHNPSVSPPAVADAAIGEGACAVHGRSRQRSARPLRRPLS